jgi:AcrR family transcriptional regulator
MPTDTFFRLPEDKRNNITLCATNAFADRGYTGTSMDAVAEAAGVAKGALYRYFTCKKDMYLHVVDTLRDDAHEFATEFIDKRERQDAFRTMRDWLASISVIQQRFETHRKVLCNVLYQESVDFKGEVLAKFGKLSTQYIKRVLQQGIANGEIDPNVDLDTAAFVIQCVTDRFHDGSTMPYLDMGYALYNQPQAVIEHKADQIIAIIRRAFGKQVEPAAQGQAGERKNRSKSA